MKAFLCFLSILCFVSFVSSAMVLDWFDVKVLDPTVGNCSIKINPGPPRSVDIDIVSFIEDKVVAVQFGTYALVEGKYNEVLSSEPVKLCDMAKSDNPLVHFIYTEMAKCGNIGTSCPLKKTSYFAHGFRVEEEDLPIPLPPGDFKIQLNGTIVEKDSHVPIFHAEIFVKEAKN